MYILYNTCVDSNLEEVHEAGFARVERELGGHRRNQDRCQRDPCEHAREVKGFSQHQNTISQRFSQHYNTISQHCHTISQQLVSTSILLVRTNTLKGEDEVVRASLEETAEIRIAVSAMPAYTRGESFSQHYNTTSQHWHSVSQQLVSTTILLVSTSILPVSTVILFVSTKILLRRDQDRCQRDACGERDFLTDNSLVRIHMIWWTGLASWESAMPADTPERWEPLAV